MLLDSDGHPTTDFHSFMGPPRGVILPFGGPKGSGLNLVVEILGGILTGNGLGKEWELVKGSPVNGVFLQAMSIEEFQPLEEFYDKIDDLIALVKSRQLASGFSESFLPGERARTGPVRYLGRGGFDTMRACPFPREIAGLRDSCAPASPSGSA